MGSQSLLCIGGPRDGERVPYRGSYCHLEVTPKFMVEKAVPYLTVETIHLETILYREHQVRIFTRKLSVYVDNRFSEESANELIADRIEAALS